MNFIHRFFYTVVFVTGLSSCGSNEAAQDPVKVANDSNAVKIDSTKKDTAGQIQATAVPVSVNPDDAKFLVNISNGGMLEIELGQIAQQEGADTRVKKFGSMMITDHTAAAAELKQLAAKKNISLPAALSGNSLKEKEKITAKTGAAFDKAYLDFMLKEHKATIAAFEKEIDKGSDPDIRDFAGRTLHVIKTHLDSADNFRRRLEK